MTFDPIELNVLALSAYKKAQELSKISDESYVELWDRYVPHEDIINNLWPVLEPLFRDETRYHVKAEIVYLCGSTYIDSLKLTDSIKVLASGLRLTLITESQKRDLDHQTSLAKNSHS